MLLRVFLTVSVLTAVGVCLLWEGFSGLAWLWMLPVGFVGAFLGLLVMLFLLILIMTFFVDMEKPQQKDNRFYRWIVHQVIEIAVPLLGIHIHAQGLEKTPKEDRCLVVCNHLFDLDPVFLMHAFRDKKLAFISKRENDAKFIIGPFLHKMMGQPINRENNREALKTILNCVRLLEEDLNSVAVFPEGYVSLDRKLHPFRSGVFKIAQRARVPIVVCTLRNTHKILPNARHLKRTDVHLHLVGVIYPEELVGVTAVDIGNRVHAMMAEDLGPELVLQD